MAIAKIKIGDNVRVISGEGKGNVGTVLSLDYSAKRVIVEGINIRKKHIKANQDFPEGEILEKEFPIHLSNVMVVDAAGKASRVGIKVENGQKIRYTKTDGSEVQNSSASEN